MYKTLLLLLLISLPYTSSAQFSAQDIRLWDKIATQKKEHYRQMMLVEKQQTTNQEGYDVKYYGLDLVPDPSMEILDGSVEIIGEVVTPNLDRVELNFSSGMFVTDVYAFHAPEIQLLYHRNNDILTILLDRDYVQGEQFHLTVTYNGRPQDSEDLGWAFGFDTHEGKPMIWSFSQPWGARGWWPCKDVPSDKADSVDIRVTVPSDLIVASNGSLRGTVTQGNTTTYWWHEKYPISTYLVSIAIYPYQVHYDDYVYNNGADTMKIHFYTFPRNYNKYASINTKVKEMIGYFSECFGEYPFIDEKYGHADFSVGGAIEHQTCTSFHFWNEWVYAHELAHQWWGDAITYESWHHTWLGEGFAVYSEALWYEHLYGPGGASEYQMQRNSYLGPGTVFVEEPENFTNIIDNPFYPGLVYQKASWILHMLRHIVGDSVFFDILKTYYASPEHQYGTASSEDFQAICEHVSGRDLDKFFHQWLYEEYFPRYSFFWNWKENGSDYVIDLEIQQEQDNWVFWMPVDITITTMEGETTFVVLDSLKIQTFQFSASSEPIGLAFDKDNWILKTLQEPIANPTFDGGILLVNGVFFDAYGFEILEAYERRAFWGDYSVSFWDCMGSQNDRTPSTLPEPMGYGRIPSNILGQFSTIIWVGNSYRGDLVAWQQTSIRPYLRAGGNVILMTRNGRDFIGHGWEHDLGISWIDTVDLTIGDCKATYPGLQDMEFLSDQTQVSVFDAELSNDESTLLFEETSLYDEAEGLGLWHKPVMEGLYRSNGGQFVFISGRPYRFDWNQLSANVEFILENFFIEQRPSDVEPISENHLPERYALQQNYPNPFNVSTLIQFYVPRQDHVSLNIYNLLGQEVRILVDEKKSAGEYRVSWDGRDNFGTELSSGVYICILKGDGQTMKRKVTLLR